MINTPFFSIIVPTYNSNITWLREMFRSVFQQTFNNYELCIVDDGSTNKEVVSTIKQYLHKSHLIKFFASPINKGIALASNHGISMSSGKYLVFLDHDDIIHSNALQEVIKVIERYPDADLIYTDENHIAQNGHLFSSYRKSDWNPDLLLSNNYICHLSIFRSSLLKKIGGFRDGFQGSQDYDLLLRFTEITDKIYHIPKVLYHWRIDPERQVSTTSNIAFDSAKKALDETLKRRHIKAKVIQTDAAGGYKIQRELKDTPLISIIISTKDTKTILDQCVKSIIKRTLYKNYEIVIVDNNSREDTTKEYFKNLLINYPNIIRIIPYNKPFNFSAIHNYIIPKVKGEYIVLLNNDTEIINGEWLEELLVQAQRKEVGAVGAKLLYPNGTIQHAGVIIGQGGVADHRFRRWKDTDDGYFFRKNVIEDVSCVTAACIMFRKEVFKKVGGFDEQHLAIAFNDVDFCLKIREAGYLIIYTPFAKLFHHEGFSRGVDTLTNMRFLKEIKFIQDKWGDKLRYDEYWPTSIGIGDQ